ncbi:aminotransferase class V-fold PLP-dependent enzyme [Gluconacetobacter azotocaptans]|uniref:aminotransferase class V-fold PLP-dependent enzyme n=1 Tax=Gluconacetobacter azotocaptans TaxID=142834 RepID=UPI0019562637|nr:aminotransferase class V-fold PLP-dependent enzyme [Gluconacetobacter azotocaptans]MBM9402124.1 aminotransferase class V-fold PLP-dependent enzyme [Gluconacetobacter azotocaptans]
MSDPTTRWIAPARAETGVYLANAACGLTSAPVLEAVTGHLLREAERGAPWAAAEARERLDAGYGHAARLIGARPDEIAFVESGNGALRALLLSVGLRAGDRVLVDRACWGGTLAMLRGLDGVSVDVMATDAQGETDVAATRAAVRPGTRLVLTTWCPPTGGLVNPADALGALAAEIGAVHLVDACQAVGQLPVDVDALRCDGLVASGRKWLRGPRGTAVLYASRRFLARTQAVMADQFGAGREDARRYEGGEAFIAGRLGLATAIEGALTLGLPFIRTRIADRATCLRDGLRALPGVRLHDRGAVLSGIVSFTIDGLDGADIVKRLGQGGVTASVVPAPYAPLEMAARGLPAIVRLAPHVFTTDAGLDRTVGIVKEFD